MHLRRAIYPKPVLKRAGIISSPVSCVITVCWLIPFLCDWPNFLKCVLELKSAQLDCVLRTKATLMSSRYWPYSQKEEGTSIYFLRKTTSQKKEEKWGKENRKRGLRILCCSSKNGGEQKLTPWCSSNMSMPTHAVQIVALIFYLVGHWSKTKK